MVRQRFNRKDTEFEIRNPRWPLPPVSYMASRKAITSTSTFLSLKWINSLHVTIFIVFFFFNQISVSASGCILLIWATYYMMTLCMRLSGFISAKIPERDSLLLILHTLHRIPEKKFPFWSCPTWWLRLTVSLPWEIVRSEIFSSSSIRLSPMMSNVG